MSTVNKEVVSNGYLTQLGIHHKIEFNEFNLTGDDHGAIYQIWGQENRQYGELRVALSTNNSDAYSYAAVTGESAYWGASKLCLTVAIPAGRTDYLWGRNITSLYYSKTSLTVSQNIVTI